MAAANLGEMISYITQAAIRRGIDPNVALEVARREALNVFDPSKPDRGGDEGSSFGIYQLHYAGMSPNMPNPGLGDEFSRRTGLDARDPSTWRQQVDFALDYARNNGWGPWMGAKAAGITGMMGIGGRPANYTATANATNTTQQTAGPIDFGSFARTDYGEPLYPDARQARSYDLSTPLADSLSARTQPSIGGGGTSPVAGTDEPDISPALEFRPSTPEEAPPPDAQAPSALAADETQETPLASLFTVKDFGQARKINSRTGGPMLPTGWGTRG